MRRSILTLGLAAAAVSCGESAVAPGNGASLAPLRQSAASIAFYGVRDLGSLGGGWGAAYDINDAGQVVGYSVTAAGQTHPFLWQNGVMQDLDPAATNGIAYGINSAGQVAGKRDNRAFLWHNGVFVWLGPFSSEAYDVSDNGHVVGRMLSGGGWRGFVWHNGSLTVLPTLGGTNSFANAVNASGVVAGYSTNAAGQTRAFRWEAGVMTDLGSLGGPTTVAEGINAAGVIVGRSTPSGGGFRAFRWNGVMQTLSTASSQAWGINDAGDVIGTVTISGLQRAVLWTGSSSRTLPGLGSAHAFGMAVNAAGEAAGWSYDASGMQKPVIWTEVTDPFPPFVTLPTATPNPVATGTAFTIASVASDATTGASAIASAEYYFADNVYVPMSAADGAFDEAIEPVTAAAIAPAPGLHSLCVRATDANGNVSPGRCITLVVYDPASSARGGGALPAADGPGADADFALQAAYRGNGDIAGMARFQLHDRSLDFRSSDLSWLVVTGPTLVLQGTGLVDGALAPTGEPYGFTIWVTDGDPDTFRIRIWYLSLGNDFTRYDSGVRAVSGEVSVTMP